MKSKNIFLLIIVLGFAMLSCQQDEKKANLNYSNSELLLDQIEFFFQTHQESLAVASFQSFQAEFPISKNFQYSSLLELRSKALSYLLKVQPVDEEIHLLIEGLQFYLTPNLSLPQQISVHFTLACLYCLVPESFFLADKECKKTIDLCQKQLDELFQGRNTFNPRVLAIQQLKKRLRSLYLMHAKVSMENHEWENALNHLAKYTNSESSELSVTIDRLENRKKEIAPFKKLSDEIGSKEYAISTIYQMEWMRVETELAELKAVLVYQNLCKEKMQSEAQCQTFEISSDAS